jgi:hypothetical protein
MEADLGPGFDPAIPGPATAAGTASPTSLSAPFTIGPSASIPVGGTEPWANSGSIFAHSLHPVGGEAIDIVLTKTLLY